MENFGQVDAHRIGNHFELAIEENQKKIEAAWQAYQSSGRSSDVTAIAACLSEAYMALQAIKQLKDNPHHKGMWQIWQVSHSEALELALQPIQDLLGQHIVQRNIDYRSLANLASLCHELTAVEEKDENDYTELESLSDMSNEEDEYLETAFGELNPDSEFYTVLYASNIPRRRTIRDSDGNSISYLVGSGSSLEKMAEQALDRADEEYVALEMQSQLQAGFQAMPVASPNAHKAALPLISRVMVIKHRYFWPTVQEQRALALVTIEKEKFDRLGVTYHHNPETDDTHPGGEYRYHTVRTNLDMGNSRKSIRATTAAPLAGAPRTWKTPSLWKKYVSQSPFSSLESAPSSEDPLEQLLKLYYSAQSQRNQAIIYGRGSSRMGLYRIDSILDSMRLRMNQLTLDPIVEELSAKLKDLHQLRKTQGDRVHEIGKDSRWDMLSKAIIEIESVLKGFQEAQSFQHFLVSECHTTLLESDKADEEKEKMRQHMLSLDTLTKSLEDLQVQFNNLSAAQGRQILQSLSDDLTKYVITPVLDAIEHFNAGALRSPLHALQKTHSSQDEAIWLTAFAEPNRPDLEPISLQGVLAEFADDYEQLAQKCKDRYALIQEDLDRVQESFRVILIEPTQTFQYLETTARLSVLSPEEMRELQECAKQKNTNAESRARYHALCKRAEDEWKSKLSAQDQQAYSQALVQVRLISDLMSKINDHEGPVPFDIEDYISKLQATVESKPERIELEASDSEGKTVPTFILKDDFIYITKNFYDVLREAAEIYIENARLESEIQKIEKFRKYTNTSNRLKALRKLDFLKNRIPQLTSFQYQEQAKNEIDRLRAAIIESQKDIYMLKKIDRTLSPISSSFLQVTGVYDLSLEGMRSLANLTFSVLGDLGTAHDARVRNIPETLRTQNSQFDPQWVLIALGITGNTVGLADPIWQRMEETLYRDAVSNPQVLMSLGAAFHSIILSMQDKNIPLLPVEQAIFEKYTTARETGAEFRLDPSEISMMCALIMRSNREHLLSSKESQSLFLDKLAENKKHVAAQAKGSWFGSKHAQSTTEYQDVTASVIDREQLARFDAVINEMLSNAEPLSWERNFSVDGVSQAMQVDETVLRYLHRALTHRYNMLLSLGVKEKDMPPFICKAGTLVCVELSGYAVSMNTAAINMVGGPNEKSVSFPRKCAPSIFSIKRAMIRIYRQLEVFSHAVKQYWGFAQGIKQKQNAMYRQLKDVQVKDTKDIAATPNIDALRAKNSGLYAKEAELAKTLVTPGMSARPKKMQ